MKFIILSLTFFLGSIAQADINTYKDDLKVFIMSCYNPHTVEITSRPLPSEDFLYSITEAFHYWAIDSLKLRLKEDVLEQKYIYVNSPQHDLDGFNEDNSAACQAELNKFNSNIKNTVGYSAFNAEGQMAMQYFYTTEVEKKKYIIEVQTFIF